MTKKAIHFHDKFMKGKSALHSPFNQSCSGPQFVPYKVNRCFEGFFSTAVDR